MYLCFSRHFICFSRLTYSQFVILRFRVFFTCIVAYFLPRCCCWYPERDDEQSKQHFASFNGLKMETKCLWQSFSFWDRALRSCSQNDLAVSAVSRNQSIKSNQISTHNTGKVPYHPSLTSWGVHCRALRVASSGSEAVTLQCCKILYNSCREVFLLYPQFIINTGQCYEIFVVKLCFTPFQNSVKCSLPVTFVLFPALRKYENWIN